MSQGRFSSHWFQPRSGSEASDIDKTQHATITIDIVCQVHIMACLRGCNTAIYRSNDIANRFITEAPRNMSHREWRIKQKYFRRASSRLDKKTRSYGIKTMPIKRSDAAKFPIRM